MDDNRFDDLTRSLATGISRRQALKLLGGGLAISLFPFLSARKAAAQPPPTCGVKTVTIWLKAFIPHDIAGLTTTVPAGPYKGQTMIHNSNLSNHCLLTDQRSFSSDSSAKARLTSIVTIDVQNAKIINSKHYSDPTTEIDCTTGALQCNKTGTVKGLKFYNPTVSGDKQTITVKYQGATSNPCIPGSPDLDCVGTITVKLQNAGQQVDVTFNGKIESFPAFEMYVAADGGAPKPVFAPQSPAPGTTPQSVIGLPTRSVSGTTTLTSNCPNGQTCCNGQCCTACQVCNNGACTPDTHRPPGSVACGSQCCDPSKCEVCDPATNTCKSCQSPKQCVNGQCVCPQGLLACGDTCCGSCQVCENGTCRNCTQCETCDNGTCVPIPDAKPCGSACCGSCQMCDNGVCRGCDPNKCESCVNGTCSPITCPPNERCVEGACYCGNRISCGPDGTCCGGICYPPGYTCCGTTFINGCAPGQKCCVDVNGRGLCGGSANDICCPDPGHNTVFICPEGSSCCYVNNTLTMCCPPGTVCEPGGTCH